MDRGSLHLPALARIPNRVQRCSSTGASSVIRQVVQDGKIVQKGKFDGLLQQNIGFEAVVGAHSQALESVVNAERSSRIPSDNHKSADSEDEFDTENETNDQLQGITKQESEGSSRWCFSASNNCCTVILSNISGRKQLLDGMGMSSYICNHPNSWIRPPFLCVYSTTYGKCTVRLGSVHACVTNWSTNITKC